jgi:flavin reductase (DIM6/NTAB) family NADH-FMN oxidoreductase RutF/DNA-binding MarR family transcriptional regulator
MKRFSVTNIEQVISNEGGTMSNTITASEFDPRDLRRALGQFPTGVTIITTKDYSGNPIGVTASSFNTVSMTPPLVLWSVDTKAFSASAMKNAEHFAVNVLAKSQIDMSNRFAGRGEDKFAGVEYIASEHGSPLFSDCAAQFECKTWNIYDGGDHLIIVGEILNYRQEESLVPLVFAGGSYAVPMPHPSSVEDETLKALEDRFLDDYMLYLLHVAYTRCSAQLYPELMNKHGIAPEEWRSLTLLGDLGQANAEYMAKTVGQPVVAFNATIERMIEKGFVLVSAAGQIKLTLSGKRMAARLLEIAKGQEELMLSGLNEHQQSDLKAGLNHIAAIHTL